MTPAEWTRIGPIFSKAAALKGPKREAYLKRACRQESIRREVESLLAQHDRSEDLIGVFSSVGGKPLGHYQCLEQVGAGGMALVYKAFDSRLNRIVAIKVLPAWGMANPDLRQRLREEAKCASALNHPNIVTVYEVDDQKGVDYIAMEYISGKTLDRSIPSRGLPLPHALRHALEIADAVATAHAAAILHGDLKPSNIMLTEEGRVKLLDFGLAKAFVSENSVGSKKIRSSVFGTLAYMAPECLRPKPAELDARSEIFSFGVILQEMLTGKHPFRAYGDDIRDAILTRDPMDLRRTVPPSVAEVVHGCLQKRPNSRFQSMRDVLFALSTGHDQSGSTHNRPGRRSPGAVFADERKIQTAIERIRYQSIPQSRQTLEDLTRLMQSNTRPALSQAVTFALRDLILSPVEFGNGGPAAIRKMRQAALDVIKVATQGRINRVFKNHDFEHLDLYEMNFNSEPLQGVMFTGSFLVASSFQGSDLKSASFAGACIRNVNFAEADLTDTDFRDADWFNALGLTERQLASLRQDTLLDCPPNVQAMHRHLEARYGFPFDTWSTPIKEQLRSTWNDYLSPNGLRDLLSRQRRNAR